MRLSGAVLLLALGPLWPQTTKPAVLTSAKAPALKANRIAPQTFKDLERRFDTMLAGLVQDPNDPVEVLQPTRGLYLEDYGIVFTSEVSLVTTPGLFPFQREIPKAVMERVHNRRIERLPALKATMKDMLRLMAMTFMMQVPNEQQVVYAVRLYYGSWEDATGMPAQILVRATRANAQAGEIQMEVQ